MPKRPGLFRSLFVFLLLFVSLWLLLYPRPQSAACPGQYVLYGALNQDESQLLVITLPLYPLG